MASIKKIIKNQGKFNKSFIDSYYTIRATILLS